MRSCPDQIYGEIEINRNTFVVKETRKDITQRNTEQPAIIIVLESPHIEEFNNGSIGPAQGKTDNNINELLIKRFSSYFSGHLKDGTEIILVNAIQYQCSLGNKDTSVWRDKVFTAAWDCFGEQCFQSRLVQVYRKDDFLINACTKGNNDIERKNELRRLVEDAIKAIRFRTDLHTLHPSCWDDLSHEDNKWLWGASYKKYVGDTDKV